MPLDLAIDDGVELPATVRTRLRREVARMVKAAALHEGRADLEVALRLCDDAAIHELNRDYRGKNKPTDVLAFAQREAATADSSLLGDIVISVRSGRRRRACTRSSCTSRRTDSATCSATTIATTTKSAR
jgi:probable rRNA maturation factor